MSRVTNVILLPSILEPVEAIHHLNERLPRHGAGAPIGEFREISDHAGGYKAFETPLWAAAFNYVDLEWLLETIFANHTWEKPEEVQVLVNAQDDEKWTLYDRSSWQSRRSGR